MLRKAARKLFLFVFISGLVLAALVFGPRAFTGLVTARHIQPAEQIAPQPVAIVFGAGLRRDGRASAVLRDRVRAAADLYFAGKVERLLLSGHTSLPAYDEPGAMQDYAVSLGVPLEALVLDEAGSSTYDTCYRAAAIYAVESAIVVTQAYHLPRAVYTCRGLGVTSTGVPAYESRYWNGALRYWQFRELFATSAALWEVHVTRPAPLILGEAEPILMEAQ